MALVRSVKDRPHEGIDKGRPPPIEAKTANTRPAVRTYLLLIVAIGLWRIDSQAERPRLDDLGTEVIS